jgi:diaminopimelate epimerase
MKVHFVDTGSPHVVVPIAQFKKRFETLDAIPVMDIGRRIRNHKAFQPEGTNVNFIEKAADNSLRIRTYERGVEAETLACGTGSIAAAIIGARLWNFTSPVHVVPLSGVTLSVGFDVKDKAFSRITLTGEARTTFSGEIDV